MTNEEIHIGNKLIQQWLYENNGVGYWSNDPLQFYYDYNWLMPVVEKIENQTSAVFQMFKCSIVCIYDYREWYINKDRLDLIAEYNYNKYKYVPFEKLETIWIAVLEFIKWHNLQPKEDKNES